MVRICKDCKHYRDIDWGAPIPNENDYYLCEHPDYYKKDIVTGKITYYNCYDMRHHGPCRFKAELFEAK